MGNRKDTYVYVTVDTDGLTQENINDRVVFSDNRDDPSGHGSDFISKVDRGKKIIWCGIVSGAIKNIGSSVAIKEMFKKDDGSSDILRRKTYKDKKGSGVVVGKVKKWDVSGEENYGLKILVNGIEYIIDPKLYMS